MPLPSNMFLFWSLFQNVYPSPSERRYVGGMVERRGGGGKGRGGEGMGGEGRDGGVEWRRGKERRGEGREGEGGRV